MCYISMRNPLRNRELVRQWKILRGIARGVIEHNPINLDYLSDIFNCSTKTIRRDIDGLIRAGFLRRGPVTVLSEVRAPRTHVHLTVDLETLEARQQDMKERMLLMRKTERRNRSNYIRQIRIQNAQMVEDFNSDLQSIELNMTQAALENFDILKCNGCTYRFKTNEAGVLD